VNVDGVTVTPALGVATTVIGPVKPFEGIELTTTFCDPPWAMVTLGGVTVSAKSGAAVIVIVASAVCVPTPAAVPVNVAVDVPTGAVGAAVTVTVVEPPAGTVNVEGENVRPATVGAVTLTVPVNPFDAVTPTASVAVWPAASVSDGGFTVNVKSGPATICTLSRATRVPVMPGAVPLKTPVRFCGAAFGVAVTVTVCEPPGVSENAGGENVRPGMDGEVTVIVPANPLTPAADTRTCALWPGVSVTVDGATERLKSGAAATLIVTVCVFVVPAVGVNVNVAVYVPGATALAACTPNVAGAVPLDGVNVIPGADVALTVTVPLKHVLGVIDAVIG
jgi:hypothetical protein